MAAAAVGNSDLP